ncbi:Mbov_0401 family ICE element transposase-like protein [Metamycoplasma alkalescens]|uniref:Mbov_0401 family ICE element transposase-like protein n=1 Tax=Metamycoplasma alkalescens TaxID=45363 RepID=UPI003B831AA1
MFLNNKRINNTRIEKQNNLEKNKPTKTYIFDKHPLLKNKYKNIDSSVYQSVIQDFLNGYSYRQNAKKHNISLGSVWSIIRHFKIEKNNLISFKKKLNSNSTNVVYISVDDTYHKFYIKKNVVHKIKFKIINFFMLNQYKKLINKNHFLILDDTSNKITYPVSVLSEKIKKIISYCYGENIKLVVTGDGASWIKTLANKLKAKYILCRFHIFQKLKVIFNNSKELKLMLKKYFNETGIALDRIINKLLRYQKYQDLIKLLKSSLDNLKEYFNLSRWTHLFNFYKYIKNNLNGLIDVPINDNLYFGNVAESFVSHLVKKKIKRYWSIYSINSILLLITKETSGLYIENYIF